MEIARDIAKKIFAMLMCTVEMSVAGRAAWYPSLNAQNDAARLAAPPKAVVPCCLDSRTAEPIPTRHLAVLKSLKDAEANISNNMTTMRDPHAVMVNRSTKCYCSFPEMSPSIGTTVRLACAPEAPAGQKSTALFSDIVWKHQTKTLPVNGSYTGFLRYKFEVDVVNEESLLILPNITFTAIGEFQCFQRCRRGGSDDLCLRKRYWLRPQPRKSADVFASPLVVTVLEPHVAFSTTCALSFPCSQTFSHFIWRYRGAIAAVPGDHFTLEIGYLLAFAGVKLNLSTTSSGPNEPGHCAQTATFTVLSEEHRAGKVECWARVEQHPDLWFVQTADVIL
ncbi:uncharacterized protein LOC129586628 [Paramacrobiotus metropolitanus]|uniref:uncharacterized protein LOC129586628 n=1 Tax=Paramacrobiotus metropolitanus TaxID=2943436 RepID=UPI0024457A12|nr:uncharacterized protein LOC129586628 [Paramacrobiotus metropolitanus]